MPMQPRAFALAIGALTLVAVALRVPTLDHQSFWIDEAAMANLVQLPLGDFLQELKTQTSPPLFYGLTWAWSSLFGTSEVALRSLAAVFGCVTVPVAAWTVARIAGRRTGLIVAAFVATSPEMVWFSQEARPYSLLVLLSALSIYLTVRSAREGGARLAALWALCAAAAILTHYFMVFVVAAEALWLLSVRGDRRSAASAIGAVGVVGLCLLPLVHTQSTRGYWPYYSDAPLISRVRAIPGAMILGEGRPIPAYALVVGGLLLVAVGLALALREWVPRLVYARGERADLGVVGVMAVGGFGLAIPLLLALGGTDYVSPHNFIGVWFPLAVGVAAGCAAPRAGRLGLIVAVLICVLNLTIVGLVYATPRYQRDDWRDAIASLGAPRGTRAVVFPLAHIDAVTYYAHGTRALGPDPTVDEIDVLIAGRPGDAPPPWPARVVAPAPGFREVGRRTIQRIRVVRFAAVATKAAGDGARPVTRAQLTVARYGYEPAAALLQSG
jgi:hypothetical protein